MPDYITIHTAGRWRAYCIKDGLLYVTEEWSADGAAHWQYSRPVVVKSETLAAVRLVLDHIERGALD